MAGLRVTEVARGLRALSSGYVERRRGAAPGAALDGAGKRAAFALVYGPLHFLSALHAVRALDACSPPPRTIVDLGCGSGVAGAAWALAAGGTPRVQGIDRHPWSVEEARWTYAHFGLRGRARRGDLSRLALPSDAAVVVAYTLNELSPALRTRVEDRLLRAVERGARLLVIEPVARAVAPWWDGLATRALALGGRADKWRVTVDLPPVVRTLDRAAGLDHRELTWRTVYAAPSS